MSIFESPTTLESRHESYVADEVVEADAPRKGVNPRSVQIAGAVTAALVALGLLVSNSAKPDDHVRPVVSTKVGPGAAAIEQNDAPQGAAPAPAPPPPVTDQPTAEAPAPATGDASAGSDSGQLTGPVRQSDPKWDHHKGKGHWR
ncbi:MAG: hypothetical protein ACJ71Z_02665 [Aeromicrobium sp.]